MSAIELRWCRLRFAQAQDSTSRSRLFAFPLLVINISRQMFVVAMCECAGEGQGRVCV